VPELPYTGTTPPVGDPAPSTRRVESASRRPAKRPDGSSGNDDDGGNGDDSGTIMAQDGSQGTDTEADDSIEESEIHDVLRNDRRRRTIEHLKSESGTVTLRELSEAIAAAETGESPPPRNIRESVYNSLHQTHLPKLDSLGVVSYDRDRKRIAIRDRARDVNLYMEVVTKYGITWGEYYRSLGVLALFTIVASEVGVPLLADAGALFVASVFLALIGLSILYQLWTRRWRYLRLLP
jgi:hypothetical protein